MANRFWVGGTAAWDGTAGTKWSDTSGGAGGFSVPTSADDVFFTNLSTGTCTISTGNTGAKSINCTGFTGTITGTAAITVSGSVTLVAGMTYSHTGTMTFNATGTLTTAGKTFSGVTVNGSAITVTLGDALNISTRNLTVTQGTFDTGNFNVTAGQLSSNNNNTRTITLGTSTVTLSSSSTAVNFGGTPALTLNANTSQITLTSGGTLSGGGLTFYNVSFTGLITNNLSISGSNTFNNLNFSRSSTGGATISFSGNNTINGSFATSGTAGNGRILFISSAFGSSRTLTTNGAISLTDADFRDIAVAGTSAPISGTRIGDLQGNSGITFSAAKTVYWNLAGAQNWNANGWASTSTGAPSTDFFPLAQDTATFTNSGSVTGTISITSASVTYLGNVDMSGRTSAMTLALNFDISVYGDWKNGSGTTLSGSSATTFLRRGTQTITSAGKSFPASVVIDSSTGTVQLADAFITNSFLQLNSGTFNTASFNVTATYFSSPGSSSRTLTLGSSTMALSNSNGFNVQSSPTFTLTSNTSQISLTAAGATFFTDGGSSTFNNPGASFHNVSFTSSSTSATGIPITGVNTFNNLTFTTPASTGVMIVSLGSNQTVSGTLTFGSANTAIRRVVVRSSSIGTQRTITLNGSLAALSDVDFRDINAAGSVATPWTGTRLGDCKGNSNITFAAPKTVYWNLAGAQNWSSTAWATTNNGVPAVNNFPLAQDTAVFTEAGAAGTVTIDSVAWNIGTIQMADGVSNRTTAFTFATGSPTPFIYGNVTLFTNLTLTSLAATYSGRTTQVITSAGKSFTSTIVNSPGGTFQLADNLTLSGSTSFNLSAGTLDLSSGNRTLSCNIFSSNNALTRSISFGSGNIALIGSVASLEMSDATNFTWTGTGGITRNQTGSATLRFGSGAGGTASNALNLTVNGGASTLTIVGGSIFKNVDFTGSTCLVTNSGLNYYYNAGNLTLASGGSYGIRNIFVASGTITSNGRTLPTLTIEGAGITVTLADALTLGAADTLTLTQGTFTAANFNVTTGLFSSSNTNTRALNMGSGTWTISGSGASAWNTSTATGLTVTPSTSTITMTSASAKTFAGGGLTYYNINQGGAGTLTISGSNTFNNITNSVQPATVTFTAGTTQTVSNFGLSGTIGNLITINSATPGSQFTLSDASGTINAQYLSIQDSNATGGALWNSFLTNGNVNAGNNTGWIFFSGSGNMFLLFG